MSADRISIPLPSTLPEELVVERLANERGDVVRLIAPERFGGILRKFALPEGSALARAVWSEGELSLEFT